MKILKHNLFLLALLIVFLWALNGIVFADYGEDNPSGTTNAQEYGDAIYRDGDSSVLNNYNHAGIYAGCTSNHNPSDSDHIVIEVTGLGSWCVNANTLSGFKTANPPYFGAHAGNNGYISESTRNNIVQTAWDAYGTNIYYTIWGQIDWYGSSWDGTIADLENIRCDGLVEVCYEKYGVNVWGKDKTHYSIVSYSGEHNNAPNYPLAPNPATEVCPVVQRGAYPDIANGQQWTKLRATTIDYPTVVISSPSSTNVNLPTIWSVTTNTITDNGGSDSQSGVKSSSHHFEYCYWTGSAWAAWTNINPYPTTNSIQFSASQNILYAFSVYVLDWAGNKSSYSDVKYAKYVPSYTLTVNSSGASGVSISSSTGHGGTTNYTKTVLSGTSVTLTAPSSASGKTFTGWTGDVTSGSQTISFSMNGPKTVTANYVTPSYTLTVNSSGASGVSISSTTGHNGTTNYTKTVVDGTSVNLQAPQYIGSGASRKSFSSWTGSVTSGSLSITFTMDTDKTVTANYLLDPEYSLSVTIQGQGSITLNPSGGTYDSGTTVQLTATASPGWYFVRWEGELSGSTNPTTILMDSDKNVTAVFEEDASRYALLVTTQGQGNVGLDPSGGTYDDGTTVQLTATANPSWHFVRWEGDLSGSTNPTTILMDSDKNVTAVFEEGASYTLSVIPQGQGNVTLAPSGGTYADGTTVQLTATASPDWHFIRWEGDLSGSANPVNILMDSNKNVTAVFDIDNLCHAIRTVPDYVVSSPVTVTIEVIPEASVVVYAVEDTPPIGWTVANINESGTWDDVNKKVKWGPFFDNTSRTLTYDLTLPPGASGCYPLSGLASFDGVDQTICGDTEICEVPIVHVTWDFDPNTYIPQSPVLVCLDVDPEASVVVYAVEDSPPIGWTVGDINEGGTWDGVNKKVKWGPFFDSTPRTLCYNATPPVSETGDKTFSGTASFDGVDEPFERTITDCSVTIGDFDNDCDVDEDDLLILVGNWLKSY